MSVHSPVDEVQELRRQLDLAYKELLHYARDFRKTVENERRKTRLLEYAHYDTVLRLTRAGELRDDQTGSHMQRLGHYAKALARALGMSEEQQRLLAAAAPCHDIGKIGVPDSILLKRGPLSDVEWDLMRRHTVLGGDILDGAVSELLVQARQIALTHHERWDGSGYPTGLSGESIPLPGRIVMFADVYDALRSERPYKRPFTHDEACQIIFQGDGRTLPAHFDPVLLEHFHRIHLEFDAIFNTIADGRSTCPTTPAGDDALLGQLAIAAVSTADLGLPNLAG